MMSENKLDVYNRRIIPQNTLEVDMIVTNPAWGTSEINPALQSRLKKLITERGLTNKEGEPVNVENYEDLWSLLSFFTRDFRLANLTSWDIMYCEYYSNLAHDELQQGFLEPFTISLSRIASKLELSQSRKGFLRKNMRTFTGENVNISEEKKRNFMNKNKGE
jgi:hypothetical protein